MDKRLILIGLMIFSLPVSGRTETDFHGPVRFLLFGNLPVVFFQDGASEVTHLQFFIGGGRSAEPVGKAGLAYLTTRLMLEIADPDDTRTVIESGASFHCEVSGDYARLSVRCLSANLRPIADVMARGMTEPIFSSLRVSFIKEQMDSFRKLEEESPERKMDLFHGFALHQGTNYSGSVFGSEETLKSIKAKDVSQFYQSRVQMKNMVVAVCSDRPVTEIREILEWVLKKLPPGVAPERSIPAPKPAENRKASDVRRKDEAYLSFAYSLPGFSCDAFVRMTLLDTLVGKGIGSRLWPLRTRLKLAYAIGTRSLMYSGGGMLIINMKVAPARLPEARTALLQEMTALADGGIGADEFAAIKELAVADYWRQLENKETMADTLGFFEIMGAGIEFIDRFPEVIAALPLESFNTYLRDILDPSRLSEAFISSGDGS